MRYSLIYADPPWQYTDKANAGKRGACHKYQVMNTRYLAGLRDFIDWLALPDCLLAMWWVPPMPTEALALVNAWGFQLKTMKGFTWHKTTKNGLDHFGMGNWTRANTEDCLFAVRGRPCRVNRGVRQLIHAPIREHSRKPDEARDRLVALLGDVPRIELFARTRFPGWDAWGNEVGAII
jgi:N6-adenosine-specific RNA methylase IME4